MNSVKVPVKGFNRLVQTRRRLAFDIKGQEVRSRERRTYSDLGPKESKAAFEVYRKIRSFLAVDKMYFSDPAVAGFKERVKTPLGIAVIENVRNLRADDYLGNNSFGILRVSLGKRQMFVKIEDSRSAEHRVLGHKIVDSFLRKKGAQIDGFRFKVEPLHAAHDFLLEKASRTIYATDFYPKESFTMVGNLPPKVEHKVNEAIKKLRGLVIMEHRNHYVGEISPVNALYNPRTKTIVLFDLYAFLAPPDSVTRRK